MRKSFERTDRIAEFMARELALLIQHKIKDPRIQKMVSVSGVTVSKDLSYAKVYISMLGDEEQVLNAIKLLNHAAGFLRTQLAQKMTTRTTPALEFVFDKSYIEGSRISELIQKITDDSEDEPTE